MKAFDNLQKALEYTVKTLIPKDHAYIINVVGPIEAAANQTATVQVVAQHMIYENKDCGLTLNLPFDPASGEFTHLVKFMGSSFSGFCDEYTYDGIPCFALRFGTNVDVATKVITFLLNEVYGYKEPTTFNCEVYDEGGVE